MNYRIRKYLPHALVALWFALPVIALADTFVPLASVTGSSKLGQLYSDSTPGDLSSFINSLFKFALAAGAIGAVLRIAYAGYLYMGDDLWSHKSEAKTIIGDVTLGLLLLLGIYLILYQINPDIVKLTALKNITPVQQVPSSGSTQTPLTQSQIQQQSNVFQNSDGTCTYTDAMGATTQVSCQQQ